MAAGIRQPVAAFFRAGHVHALVAAYDGSAIQQAVGTTKDRHPETAAFLRELIEELKSSGFVADALRRSGQAEAAVVPR